MTESVARARLMALDAIDRRREEASVKPPSREDLDVLGRRQLRSLASQIRAKAWTDTTSSAEESDEDFNDLGWAPSAALRTAALIDHLAELSSGVEWSVTQPSQFTAAACPAMLPGAWSRVSANNLADQLDALAGDTGREVAIYDVEERVCIARATSWRGEIVEVLDLLSLPSRRRALQNTIQSDNSRRAAAKLSLERLEERETAWAESCVRAGFARPQFGPELTAEFFERHVTRRERLDVTVDLNAIINGIVHHIARVAPHIDFARSLITDLEIQRLGDHDKKTWRKAVRTLELLPVSGPAWRSLGHLDPTALLVARSEQKGKAPGADALMVHNFETALLRSNGVRSVLLSCDNGLARSVASRLSEGRIWVAYVDALNEHERFVSPLLSWPKDAISASHYSALSYLIDEILVCGVTGHLIASDGDTTLEFRGHLEGEHQFVRDWLEPRMFVRGLNVSHPRGQVAQGHWPLRRLEIPDEPRASGARVTVEQVAIAMEWLRGSVQHQLERNKLPLKDDAQREAWTFLKAVGLIDQDGIPIGRTKLVRSVAQHDVEDLRQLVLQFEPVARIVAAVKENAKTVTAAKKGADLGERTFGAALGLAVASGLVWRSDEELGIGIEHIEPGEFRDWLARAAATPTRISHLAHAAARQLGLSVPRFRAALQATLTDPLFSGSKGGSTEADPMDCKVLDIDETGHITVEEVQADDLLGLRSLTVRS